MSDIRIIKGRKITSRDEYMSFQRAVTGGPVMLVGSASNYEAVRNDTVLYSQADLYSNQRFCIPLEGMAAVNIAVAAMGRGKTTLLENIIVSCPNNNMIIHDPKGEYNVSFYDAEKGDMIVAYPDSGSVVWDVFKEIRQDRQVAELIWRNMLRSVKGDAESGGDQWITYAISWLVKLSNSVIEDKISYADIPAEIVRKLSEFQRQTSDSKTGMQSDALGTAAPVFGLLFQMYYVGVKDGRRFVTVDDMLGARRVFLCNNTRFSAQLKIVNNALLACLVNRYLSRPNIGREEVGRYTFFLLDEYLTFSLDRESESALLTLCRSKGISVWLGMQHLPTDNDRLTDTTTSRYATFAFKLDDSHTREEIERLSDDLEYQRIEDTVSMSESGGLSLSGGSFSTNETFVDVKTKQITKQILASLTPYVAFCEINSLYGRIITFVKPPLVKKLKNPCRINAERGEEGFLYSDIARNAPRIEEFIV